MSKLKYAMLFIPWVVLGANSDVPSAGDPCATFFWTGSHNEPVDRYQSRYLIGQGLEDVGMDQIVGTRIRYKWSQQAASCFASSNHYGYFGHVDFQETDCAPSELCFPGTRFKKFSEQLSDVVDVIQRLEVPNPDATYQASLDRAKTSSFQVVDTMANAVTSTATFYHGLTANYDQVISQLTRVLNLALPPSVRTAIFDQVCAPDNVGQLEGLYDQCFDQDHYCELTFLFNTINDCIDYQNGLTLQQLLERVAEAKNGLLAERGMIAIERDAIMARWAEIQNLR